MKKRSLLLLFCLKISYTVKNPNEIYWNPIKEKTKTYRRDLALKIKKAMESKEEEKNEVLQLPIHFSQPQTPTMFSFLNNFPPQNTELSDTQKANELMKPEENA